MGGGSVKAEVHGVERQVGGANGLPLLDGLRPGVRITLAVMQARLEADVSAAAASSFQVGIELVEVRLSFGSGGVGQVNAAPKEAPHEHQR